MPLKKDKKVEKVDKITKDKKVRFNKDDENENILKNAPKKEKIQ